MRLRLVGPGPRVERIHVIPWWQNAEGIMPVWDAGGREGACASRLMGARLRAVRAAGDDPVVSAPPIGALYPPCYSSATRGDGGLGSVTFE